MTLAPLGRFGRDSWFQGLRSGFRAWRRTRPFWGGLWCILGGAIIAYGPTTAIKIILDNHSAHVSQETKTWLAARPEKRFQFVFTPKHGSWLNLVEGFFAKAARSVLRHIRVGSKHELKQRIMEFIDDLNRDPVIHRWHYQIDTAA